jgi:hypothetical protein
MNIDTADSIKLQIQSHNICHSYHPRSEIKTNKLLSLHVTACTRINNVTTFVAHIIARSEVKTDNLLSFHVTACTTITNLSPDKIVIHHS